MKTNHDLESIFAQALDLPDPTRRRAFLDDACGANAGLRNRIGRLLAANQRADAFMAEPAVLRELPDEQRSEEAIGEQPGDLVGKYKLLQQIGEGGMGTVFMAEQVEPVRRKVALKIVKPGLDTKEVIARFESERQALAMMNHAHVARVLDAGATQQGRPYFAMELVKGIPVTDYCNDAKLTARERLEVFVPICHAIQHAHQKGIIHRDIKPSNVMVTLVDGKPVPKVIDFGIAKAIDYQLTEKTLFTRYGEFIGTPAYMSPEQAAVSGIDVDTRSDVYSLGALLYELLVGVPPFESDQLKPLTHDEIRRFIREETPRQPSDAIHKLSTAGVEHTSTIATARNSTLRELKSQLHGELDWIVMRALAKERSRRYETASSLADDIERYLRNETVVARPPTVSYRWKKFVSRNRVWVAAACTIAATLLATASACGWLAYATIRAQRNEAREAATLRAHVDFINHGLFAQADPLAEPNRNITVRSVLDRASQQLVNRPIQDKATEAAIRTTIGESYRGLGEYRSSLVHLNRAYQLCMDEFGEQHRDSVAAGNRLATVLLAMAKHAEVKQLLNRQVAIVEREFDERDELTLEVKKLLASQLEAFGEHGKAEKLLRQLLKTRREMAGAEHPDTYVAMANLAFVLQSQQRYDEALELLEPAQEGMLQARDQWHPNALKVTAGLANLHASRNEADRAEETFAATLPKLTRLLGPDHPQTLTAKHSLALLRFGAGRVTDAEEMLSHVLESQNQQLGPSHPSTLTTMHNLALVRKRLGKFVDAETLLKQELKLRRDAFAGNHATTRNAISSLAFFYLDQAQFAEAIPYYEELTAAYQTLSPDDPNGIIALTMLGLCRHKSGDNSQASANLETALAKCESGLDDHWLTYTVVSLLGEVYATLGQPASAEAALLRGYEGLKVHAESVPERWQAMGLRSATRRLAEFYASAQDTKQRSRSSRYREELREMQPLRPSRAKDLDSLPNKAQPEDIKDGDPN